MYFEPFRVFLHYGRVAKLAKKDFLRQIPDCGFEIHIPSGCNVRDLSFSKNKIYYGCSGSSTIPPWVILHEEVNIVFCYSMAKFTIKDILQEISQKRKKIHNQLHLQIADSSVKDFLNQPMLNEIFSIFPLITILNETSDGKLLNEFVPAEHHFRRRACRYPFESVTMDFDGNVLQCPYCENILTKFSDFSSLLKDSALLNFLAAQLLVDINLFPQCDNCPYWIDGWLGEEKGHIQNKYGDYFNLVWEGHSCSIKRRKSK